MSQKHSKHQKILHAVEQYYTKKLQEYGAIHKGVDWNSEESQNLRFDQLIKVTDNERSYSVIDYGCGYGALAAYMRKHDYKGPYTGFDISKAMIKEAINKQPKLPNYTFVSDANLLKAADYTIASGVFNVKQNIGNDEWLAYIVDTIRIMAEHSRKGFSFNMLTKYSDRDKMRPDLFYGDPCFFIDHCIRNFSRNVAMLHDYGLYEFTILVRMM